MTNSNADVETSKLKDQVEDDPILSFENYYKEASKNTFQRIWSYVFATSKKENEKLYLLHNAKNQSAVKDLCFYWCKKHACTRFEVDNDMCNECNLTQYLDALNSKGETALLMRVKDNESESYDCILELLINGANVNIPDKDGNSALHWAVMKDNAEIVKLLLVFGAIASKKNKKKESPRHLAVSFRKPEERPERQYILYYLHCFGAKRCKSTLKLGDCGNGCSENGECDICKRKLFYEESGGPNPQFEEEKCKSKCFGLPPQKEAENTKIWKYVRRIFDQGFCNGNMEHAKEQINAGVKKEKSTDCMDGGGIRGLIIIQLLMAIERSIKESAKELRGAQIVDYFDWIGGTSTGGILALALASGKSLLECQSLYFRLKDKVFDGTRWPGGIVNWRDSETMNKFLRQAFGRKTHMTELPKSKESMERKLKVLVTATLVDRDPAQLHFFRNYKWDEMNKVLRYNDVPESPGPDFKKNWVTPLVPEEQLVWEAARATSAAPTYFASYKGYVDGGLVSNNPTLDILTEIFQCHTTNKVTKKIEHPPLLVVVSLGTGRTIERKRIEDFNADISWFHLIDKIQTWLHLVQLLLKQSTQTEDQPFERSWAWCSMMNVPFFRFSPSLSGDVEMDCKKNRELINMLYETQFYLFKQSERVSVLSYLLQRKIKEKKAEPESTAKPAVYYEATTSNNQTYVY